MRLAIITDIHEDLIALQSALRSIEKFKCDKIVCLGDISGYSIPYYDYLQTRNAHECLRLTRENCNSIILGNHDIHAASIIPKNCTFFDFPDDWYLLNYHQRHQLANSTLWLHEENDLNPLYKEDDIAYLKSLPEYTVFETNDLNILFSHYAFPNISGLKKDFYTYKDEFEMHHKFMDKMNCDVSFVGHTHVKGFFAATENQFKQFRYKRLELKKKPICVGLPPITRQNNRNGFCIFDTSEMNIQVIKL